MRNKWIQGGWEDGRVQCLQNQRERHVEKLIFLILISLSPAAWRLGGSGDGLETQAPSGRWGWSVRCWASPFPRQAWLGGKGPKDEVGAASSLRP